LLGISQMPPAMAALRAGAARIDITPDESKLPKEFQGVNDRIFVRALQHVRSGVVEAEAGMR
jgi:hypothetical protein